MAKEDSSSGKKPGFLISIIPIIMMAIVMGVGFGVYRYSIEVLLLICSFITVALAIGSKSATWKDIADAVSEKVGKSFMAIFIFVFVGMIIGTWMLSGTIPMMVYYGLKFINPSLFYVSAFLITIIVSLCTGTSFGSIGTVGLALIGVAQGLGVNLTIAAGAIVSGAYVGDKMSPLSDTSNLEAVVAGVDLFKHIAHMLYTTLPAGVICIIVYFIAGQNVASGSTADSAVVTEMLGSLESLFHFNLLLLLPLVVVLVGSAIGKPTIPVMFVSSLVAAVLAILLQGATLSQTITAAYNGFKITMLTDQQVPDMVSSLLERGGMMSMMATVLKVLCAFLFAGAMSAAGFLDAILDKLKTFIHSDGSLILVTVVSTLVIAIVVGNAYVPILIGGELFKDVFEKRNLDPRNMSLALGDVGCCSIPLIPWSAAGAYITGTLGISTFYYAPWAIFNYSGIILAVIWGYLGVGIIHVDPETRQPILSKKRKK